jgi:hypothetical protein
MSLSMSWDCSGCRKSIKDDSDMLVEINQGEEPVVIHVDHITAIGLKMRTRFYGPYCDEKCWRLDAMKGDVFNDQGHFSFAEGGE